MNFPLKEALLKYLDPTIPHFAETEEEAVWVLQDWKNLGPATAVQILDESGIPEVPGDCQR